MRNLHIYLSALATLSVPVIGLRHGSRQLRDMLAFPKYQVEFMNELPLSHSDAERCRAMGVEDEDEFTQVRFEGKRRRSISESDSESTGGENAADTEGPESGDSAAGGPRTRLELVPMKLPSLDGTHEHDYLCLMPSDNSTASQMSKKEEYEEVDPAQGWAALSHLDGKCLYTKQGWFTYSYCHNSHIRQFRQAPHQHPHPPGGFVPQEDTRYEAYTLGQVSPPSGNGRGSSGKRKPSLPGQNQNQNKNGQTQNQNHAKRADPQLANPDLKQSPATSIDRLNHDHAVSYGLQPSSRYLLQRWSDGTRCDKTSKPREIEVQLHCSMTTTDTIYLIKELSICQYVMIIHTPHLCGLPGFRADHTPIEEAKVRCREVIGDEDFERWGRGEEVEMPFLTIGKEGSGSGSGSDSVSDRDSVNGGGEGEVGFLWQSQSPDSDLGGLKAGKPTEEEMRVAISQISEYLKDRTGGRSGEQQNQVQEQEQEQEQEVFIFTMDVDGDGGRQGAVLIESDLDLDLDLDLDFDLEVEVEGQGGGQGVNRDMVMKLVKEYLRDKRTKDKATKDVKDNSEKDAKGIGRGRQQVKVQAQGESKRSEENVEDGNGGERSRAGIKGRQVDEL